MTGQRGPRTCAVLALVFALLLAACGSGTTEVADSGAASATDPNQLSGYERSPEPQVSDFTIPAVNREGQDFAFQAEPGEMLLVYFGFASCPDICPTTLADTRIALNGLGDRASQVDVALVTVDPGRDTEEITTDYIEAFIDGGIALRTDDNSRLLAAADAFGVSYSVVTNDAGEIEVGHTPALFVVDDSGRLKLTWPFGTTAADMTKDLNILFDRQ